MDDRSGARRFFEAAREIYRTADPTRVASIDHVLAHLDPVALEVLAQRPRLVVARMRDGQTRPVLNQRGTGGGAPLPSSRRREMNDVFVLGRGIERVHMALLDATVARAQILWRERLRWEIEDCASVNGTVFEGKRMTAHTITDGDVYVLGDERIECRLAPPDKLG